MRAEGQATRPRGRGPLGDRCRGARLAGRGRAGGGRRAGFIRVDAQLQSLSHPGVFAAGDVAALPARRPKSGVFAVRQGPVLADNLQARSHRSSAWSPTGHSAASSASSAPATGTRWPPAADWSLEGAWLWRAKDWIDRRFMTASTHLPTMPTDQAAPALAAGHRRPGGDQRALDARDALRRLRGQGRQQRPHPRDAAPARPGRRADVLIGLDAPDDAAMLAVPPGKALVQSVDYFRAFLDDAYTFGQIAANHALGDVLRHGRRAPVGPGHRHRALRARAGGRGVPATSC